MTLRDDTTMMIPPSVVFALARTPAMLEQVDEGTPGSLVHDYRVEDLEAARTIFAKSLQQVILALDIVGTPQAGA